MLRAVDDNRVTPEELRKLFGIPRIRKGCQNATPMKRLCVRTRARLVVVRNQNPIPRMRLKQVTHHHPPNRAHTTENYEIAINSLCHGGRSVSVPPDRRLVQIDMYLLRL